MREPITKQKTYELIADQLLGEIGTRLHPGDTFPTERELTESFKVGRSSVREGLRML
jgi:GntR family transcriptional regulator, transcriptional repressor for pyruvate dehydrogenase complex